MLVRTKMLLAVALVVYTLVLLAMGCLLGQHTFKRSIGSSIDFIQGSLVSNHYTAAVELTADLQRGCVKTVLEKLNMQSETDLALLASLVQEEPQGPLVDYFKLHAPEALQQAQSYDLKKMRRTDYSFTACPVAKK